MAETFVVPANASKMCHPILDDPHRFFRHDKIKLSGSVGGGTTSKGLRQNTSCGHSPFKVLEKFVVNTLGKREGLVGSIGTWSLCTQRPLPQRICFNMKGNRYCEKIGRAHKSNNVIWNIHLVDRVCWQSCYDPDCRGFHGELIDLPTEVNNEIDEYFLDSELSALKDSEICKQNKTIF